MIKAPSSALRADGLAHKPRDNDQQAQRRMAAAAVEGAARRERKKRMRMRARRKGKEERAATASARLLMRAGRNLDMAGFLSLKEEADGTRLKARCRCSLIVIELRIRSAQLRGGGEDQQAE